MKQGDKVLYCGRKYSKLLEGKIGTVAGRVANTESGVVVDFPAKEGEENSFVLDENKHVCPLD